jgi:hypothetical protein
MGKSQRLNFSLLLGFHAVSDVIAGGVDFQDETVAARLGAKVGELDKEPASKLAFEKPLGLDASDQLSVGVVS